MATAAHKGWQVHGARRLSSMAKMSKVTYLYLADVLPVIEPLDPSQAYLAGMLRAIAATIAAYFGPRLLKQKQIISGRRCERSMPSLAKR